jgi:hypothetical protein
VTLEDVALLFRLPCSGEPWGLVTNPPPPKPWCEVLLARFAGVVRHPCALEVQRTLLYLSVFHSICLQSVTDF